MSGALDTSGNPLSSVGYRDGVGSAGALDLDMLTLQGMGSTLLCMTAYPVTTTFSMVDQTLQASYVYLPTAATLTGVTFFQSTQGVYTASNNNRIGLYTADATNLTKVAATTDDGTLWKGATNSFVSKDFSSTYAAAAGGYWIVALWCRSAQTTAPVIGALTSLTLAGIESWNNNNVKSSWNRGAQTDIPATTLAWTSCAAIQTQRFFGLY